jgi:hypothetical protein
MMRDDEAISIITGHADNNLGLTCSLCSLGSSD